MPKQKVVRKYIGVGAVSQHYLKSFCIDRINEKHEKKLSPHTSSRVSGFVFFFFFFFFYLLIQPWIMLLFGNNIRQKRASAILHSNLTHLVKFCNIYILSSFWHYRSSCQWKITNTIKSFKSNCECNSRDQTI